MWNTTTKFSIAQLIIDNILISQSIAFVKRDILVIQDFSVIDYLLDKANILIQLYHIPTYNERKVMERKGKQHLINRTPLLIKKGYIVINISVEEIIFDFENTRDRILKDIHDRT